MTLLERLCQIRDCAVFHINAALPKDAHLAGETVDEAIRTLTALSEENTRLRAALATSKDPCVYCQLPAEELHKCESGFPGCGRMDDLIGCPNFGAMMELQQLREQHPGIFGEQAKLRPPGARGRKGGLACAASMTADERTERARKGAAARWRKPQ